MTATVNDSNFQSEVLGSPQPVLIDFWAPWCGPCQALAPIVDEIATEYDGRLKVLKADVSESPQAAARYGVSSIPHVVVFNGGQVKAQLTGLRPKQELVDMIQPWLN